MTPFPEICAPVLSPSTSEHINLSGQQNVAGATVSDSQGMAAPPLFSLGPQALGEVGTML